MSKKQLQVLVTANQLVNDLSTEIQCVVDAQLQHKEILENYLVESAKELEKATLRHQTIETLLAQTYSLSEVVGSISTKATSSSTQMKALLLEEERKCQHKTDLMAINRRIAAIKREKTASAEKEATEEANKEIQELLYQQQKTRRASVMESVRSSLESATIAN